MNYKKHILIKKNFLDHCRPNTLSALAASFIAAVLLTVCPRAYAIEAVLVSEFKPYIDDNGNVLNNNNPGNLTMYKYVPIGLGESAPLVVVLHGCIQTAKGFDAETGWIQLADEYKFAVVFPQQEERNNYVLCFNFFQESHSKRDKGEARSIVAMVEKMQADYSIDRNRIYITGLSGGGGMTAVMLAVYPDIFRAGAIIAGAPYGCAEADFFRNPILATTRYWSLWNPFGDMILTLNLCGVDEVSMRWWPYKSQPREPEEWGDLVRRAAPKGTTKWPNVSIWQGKEDPRVDWKNIKELAKQWTNVHGINYSNHSIDENEQPDETYTWTDYRGGPEDKHTRKHFIYVDDGGDKKVEAVLITGLKHAIAVGGPPDCGWTVETDLKARTTNPSPETVVTEPVQQIECTTNECYIIDIDYCTAREIAKRWELVPAQ